MRRIILLACLAWAAAAPAGRALDIYGIAPDIEKGVLTVVGGTPYRTVGGPAGGDWELMRATGKTTINVFRPERYKGKYLAYDPTGKKDGVFLVDKKGKGTEWQLENVGGVYTIRAAAGVNKGWYLDAGAKPERVRPAKGKPFDAHPLRLTKKPGVSRFEITQIAP